MLSNRRSIVSSQSGISGPRIVRPAASPALLLLVITMTHRTAPRILVQWAQTVRWAHRPVAAQRRVVVHESTAAAFMTWRAVAHNLAAVFMFSFIAVLVVVVLARAVRPVPRAHASTYVDVAVVDVAVIVWAAVAGVFSWASRRTPR